MRSSWIHPNGSTTSKEETIVEGFLGAWNVCFINEITDPWHVCSDLMAFGCRSLSLIRIKDLEYSGSDQTPPLVLNVSIR
jgi:hypothetical protein